MTLCYFLSECRAFYLDVRCDGAPVIDGSRGCGGSQQAARSNVIGLINAASYSFLSVLLE